MNATTLLTLAKSGADALQVAMRGASALADWVAINGTAAQLSQGLRELESGDYRPEVVEQARELAAYLGSMARSAGEMIEELRDPARPLAAQVGKVEVAKRRPRTGPLSAAQYKALRGKIGSQAVAAEALGVSRVSIARRETGAQVIDREAELALRFVAQGR